MPKNANIVDLIKNEHFVHWIINPSEEATHYWTKWVAKNPDRKADVARARQLILSTGYQIDDKMPEDDYDIVLENIVLYGQQKRNKTFSIHSFSWKAVGIAASLVLAMFIGVLLTQKAAVEDPQVATVLQVIHKENPRGQKSTIILPDGTKAILNSESSLSYKAEFSGTERRVRLNGEAFFEVAHDSLKPFIVETSHLSTMALGTSFNVDAYPGQTEEVTLLTGKVRVNSNGQQDQSEILLPGDVVAIQHGVLAKSRNADLNHVKWKDGVIVFQSTPFNKGILELERWYGVTINVENKPERSGMTFTALIENDNLSNVLQTLSYAMRFDYSIEGKNVYIKFK